MALLMVMTVCLLVYAALEYRIRTALKEHEATFPDQKGKRIQHPTARWVFHKNASKSGSLCGMSGRITGSSPMLQASARRTAQRLVGKSATRAAPPLIWPNSWAKPVRAWISKSSSSKSIRGNRVRTCSRTDGDSAVLTGPCCVLAAAHVSWPPITGLGQTPSCVSPSPAPPWGSIWAASCGHATSRPSVQRSPGAAVTVDAQLGTRRAGA